ncbi:MAG TPA: HEAT repeat domain-containing protein [Gemmatimonadaceae bacterium]|nr:HEAT repeat domain-containing protein [Gemmatimonadaceae bacterium]
MTRTMGTRALGIASIVLASFIPPHAAKAQNLARRVNDAPDGKVRFEFAARQDLCGTGNYVSHGPNNRMSWDSDYSEDVEYSEDCVRGPVRVVITKNGGQISRIRTYMGGRWRATNERTTTLGVIGVRDATDYLLSVANNTSSKVGSEAIFPTTLADSVEVWPALLRLARDDNRPTNVRTQAVFWLGQMASDAVTSDLSDLANQNSVDREIRKQAVFALSQRPHQDGVPALLQIARTNPDREIRKTALFWLGQSRDPRALALFEEILSRR